MYLRLTLVTAVGVRVDAILRGVVAPLVGTVRAVNTIKEIVEGCSYSATQQHAQSSLVVYVP